MAVIQHSSVTRASKELGVSQPAVSRLLADLRQNLGFPLFDRRNGQLVPTQEVRFLQADIQRVLDLMGQIGEVSQSITERKTGHIRIACLPGFATSHLPKVVAQFLKDRPGVSITIEPDRPERILEWMIDEQFDFGITDGFRGHPAVISTDIDVRTVCIFPDGHHLETRSEISPRDLIGDRIIHTRRDSEFFKSLSDAFLDADAPLKTLVETRQFTAACELVSLGLGVAIVSELDALKFVGKGIQARPFKPVLTHRLSLLRPMSKQLSAITLEFISAFTSSLEPFQDAKTGR
ncbi:LysR family transcriptional regulator [Pelagimonas varians]|uniref:HTH-type transcriptional regulator CynR n=2 Tax=Pelagimonas varians TaxID=696760 RepID=A0A238L699_9RHOB|nr:LysR family transcriptional regulator [Pelagimonas varians]SMX50615.1 HTH-type transcriptional regulator CynR [Pelagimonas varians]